MRKPKVKTFDELNKGNFTILYAEENVQELGTEFIKRLVIRYETLLATKNIFKPILNKFLNIFISNYIFNFFSIKSSHFYNTSYNNLILTEPENKVSTFTLSKQVKTTIAHFLEGVSSLDFIQENLATLHFSVFLKKLSPMNKAINRKIGLLLQSGIIQKLEEYRHEAVMIAAKKVKKQEKEKLTLDQLALCFVAILICWGICFLVFVIECVVNLQRRWGRSEF